MDSTAGNRRLQLPVCRLYGNIEWSENLFTGCVLKDRGQIAAARRKLRPKGKGGLSVRAHRRNIDICSAVAEFRPERTQTAGNVAERRDPKQGCV